jgi:SPP1 gp7 family putative phage head morphogenesis protein
MTAALFDSVFGTFRYSDRSDLMPMSDIVKGMGKIELDTLEKLNNLTKLAVRKLAKESQGKSLTEIAKLNWNLAPDIADQINITWDKAYKTGSKHAIEEMKAAVPVRQNSSQYAKVADLIKDIFELKPFSAFDRPKASVKKILNRNLAIAGNYSKDILERVKTNVSQGMIVQPLTGFPMPPKQVNALLQQTLSVSQARAAMISRTETTNAYNAARVETFKQSSLATHCRFLAIADNRVTDICLTRNGIVFPIEDAAKYQPSLHVNCRSSISILLPKINPQHAKMIVDPNLNPNNRVLAPMPTGWIKAETKPEPKKVEPKVEVKVEPKVEPKPSKTSEDTIQGDAPSNAQFKKEQLNKLRKEAVNLVGAEAVDLAEKNVQKLINEGDMYIRVPPSALDKIISGGRFKSSFEVSGKGADYNKRRAAVEDLKFGIGAKSEKSKRPIYGYLGDKEFDNDAPDQAGPNDYGSVAIRMKSEAKQRASITDNDTWSSSLPSEAKSFNGASLTQTSYGDTILDFRQEGVKDAIEKAGKAKSVADLVGKLQTPYMEMHLHGGAKTSDIAELIYTKGDRPSKKTEAWAKKNGVTITIK